MKNTSRYFIQEFAEIEFFHGGIGPKDAEKILLKEGYQPIRFPHQFNFSLKAKIDRFRYLVKMIRSIRVDSTVVFIFPLYARINRILVWSSRIKKVKLICYIADINGLKDGNVALLESEKQQLRKFNTFILHNNSMKDWLNGVVQTFKSANLEFFDFLTQPIKKERTKRPVIVFAGNLEKSRFLSKLHQLDLQFILYGPGVNEDFKKQKNVSYQGIIEPHLLPSIIEGSFGLVWDGDDIEGPGGSLGHYMKYITHHKLSLYILSGLPIITACFAGSAPLVKKYKIGVCVEDLREIPKVIQQLPEVEYQDMITNMQPLAKKISSGGFLSEALKELSN